MGWYGNFWNNKSQWWSPFLHNDRFTIQPCRTELYALRCLSFVTRFRDNDVLRAWLDGATERQIPFHLTQPFNKRRIHHGNLMDLTIPLRTIGRSNPLLDMPRGFFILNSQKRKVTLTVEWLESFSCYLSVHGSSWGLFCTAFIAKCWAFWKLASAFYAEAFCWLNLLMLDVLPFSSSRL